MHHVNSMAVADLLILRSNVDRVQWDKCYTNGSLVRMERACRSRILLAISKASPPTSSSLPSFQN